MPSFILDFVKYNNNVDYTVIIPIVLGYLLFFWILVSFWVLWDTRNRIKNKFVRVLIFLLNIVFGIPFLMLYLLARPFDKEEMAMISGNGGNEPEGGVNVPLVNFVGKNGMVMSLEIKINPSMSDSLPLIDPAKMNFSVEVKMDSDSPELVATTPVKNSTPDSQIIVNAGNVQQPKFLGMNPKTGEGITQVDVDKNKIVAKDKTAGFAGKIRNLFKTRLKSVTAKPLVSKSEIDKTKTETNVSPSISSLNNSAPAKIHKNVSKKARKRHH